jgi:hypothetical protein
MNAHTIETCVTQTFDLNLNIERSLLDAMAGFMIRVLFVSILIQLIRGDYCFPCVCEYDFVDCSEAQFIPPHVYRHIAMSPMVIVPAYLIDRQLVQLQVLIQPTDTQECTRICSMTNVRTTCTCEVSLSNISNV